jgi:hypothetical protein
MAVFLEEHHHGIIIDLRPTPSAWLSRNVGLQKASKHKQQRHCRSRHWSTGTDSACASTKAKMKAAMLRPCQASSSLFPRAGRRIPQAPWPNQALHRTAQKSAPPVNLVVQHQERRATVKHQQLPSRFGRSERAIAAIALLLAAFLTLLGVQGLRGRRGQAEGPRGPGKTKRGDRRRRRQGRPQVA